MTLFGMLGGEMVIQQGLPLGFFLTLGGYRDTSALKSYYINLPKGVWITGDKAFTDYTLGDIFQETLCYLLPLRKKEAVVNKGFSGKE